MGGSSFAQATTNLLWVNLITRNEASQLFQSVYLLASFPGSCVGGEKDIWATIWVLLIVKSLKEEDWVLK